MATTFPQLMLEHATQRPQAAALREKEYGIWQTTTWAALAQLVRALACGLASAGVKRGDHLVVVGENPLANLKVLYGTGHIRLGPDGKPHRVGGVRYTIKDGIVYDAVALRADVRKMVADEKARLGIDRLTQPGDPAP